MIPLIFKCVFQVLRECFRNNIWAPEEAAVHLCTGLMSIRSTYAKGKLSYLFFSQNSVAEHSSCKPHGTSEWNDCIQNNSKENITYRNLEGIAKAVPREKWDFCVSLTGSQGTQISWVCLWGRIGMRLIFELTDRMEADCLTSAVWVGLI